MSYRHLTIEHHEPHTAVVTFNRAEKANALNPDLLEEIERLANSFRDDEESRVVIFTGAGSHFTSGADLSDERSAAQRDLPLVLRRRTARYGERATRALFDMDQITIAAMNGAAMGGGAVLASALDFRIGSSDCFIAYPEIDIGVNLQWTGLPLLCHLVGPARAKQLVIGGERASADTLESWGFLDEVVPTERLLQRALELATFYAGKAPVPAQMIKRSVNHIVSALDRSIMHMDFDQNLFAAASDDAREAVRSYLAGETPLFRGD